MKLTKETVSEIVAEMKQLLVGVGDDPHMEITAQANAVFGPCQVWDFNRNAAFEIIRAYGDTPEEAVASFMLLWNARPGKAAQKRIEAAKLIAEAAKIEADEAMGALRKPIE